MQKTYIGYARVSTEEQNEARQLESFRTFSETISKTFIDKCSGKKPLPVDETRFMEECAKWRSGEQTAVETMLHLNIKPNRFYRLVKRYGIVLK